MEANACGQDLDLRMPHGTSIPSGHLLEGHRPAHEGARGRARARIVASKHGHHNPSRGDHRVWSMIRLHVMKKYVDF